jgi:integrase
MKKPTKSPDQKQVTKALGVAPDGSFAEPKIHRDRKVRGLLLVVGKRKASWQLSYIPHGKTSQGKRYGRAQTLIGDATLMSLPVARMEAQALKAVVGKGGDPHRDRQEAKAAAVAQRALEPTTLAEAHASYQTDLLRRMQPSLASRKAEARYSAKALALMGVAGLLVGRLETPAIRKMVRETQASPSEINHLFGATSRFCDWLVEERLLETSPCLTIPRNAKPKLRRRGFTPPLSQLKVIWEAVETERPHVRGLIRFLLLTPLRRDEAAGLTWSEVDLNPKDPWVRISASRMKAGEIHELPLSDEASAILRGRLGGPGALVFATREDTVFDGWTRVVARIRKVLGQDKSVSSDPTRRADHFALHDIRRAFVTHLAGKFDENLLDLMLAHRPVSRTGSGAAYQTAKRLGERPPVIKAWTRLVLGRSDGADNAAGDFAPPSNLVPFARAV